MNVKFKIGLKSKLDSQQLVEGAWYLCKDAGELYYCYENDQGNLELKLVDATNNLKSVTITAGEGLKDGGTADVDNNTVIISHQDKPTSGGNDAGGSGSYVTSVKVDKFGHVVSTSKDTPSIPSATTTKPKMDGAAAVGSESKWAKGDHVHPTDTSRLASATYTAFLSNLKNIEINEAVAVGIENTIDLTQQSFSIVITGSEHQCLDPIVQVYHYDDAGDLLSVDVLIYLINNGENMPPDIHIDGRCSELDNQGVGEPVMKLLTRVIGKRKTKPFANLK